MSIRVANHGNRLAAQNRSSIERKALIREVRERVKQQGYDIVDIVRDLLKTGSHEICRHDN